MVGAGSTPDAAEFPLLVSGTDASGIKRTARFNANGAAKVSQSITTGAVSGAMNVSNAAASEVKVGASALGSDRETGILNTSGITYYWGFTNGVTAATGWPIYPNQAMKWYLAGGIAVYVIAASGTTNDARVYEAPIV